jgi:vacuolar-type H+-ATPase subunit I/STV1
MSELTAQDLLRELKDARAEAAKYRTMARRYKEDAQKIAEERDSAFADLEELASKTQAMAEEFDQEREELTQKAQEQLETLEKERDDFKQQAETLPDDIAATITEYQSKLRSLTHRDAWAKAVGDKLTDGASIENLWKLAGYTPDSDEIDDKALSEQVKAALEAHPYLFKPAVPETPELAPGGPSGQQQAKPRPTPLANGIDNGRAVPESAPSRFRITPSQAADPQWVADHYAEYQAASDSGTIDVVPD